MTRHGSPTTPRHESRGRIARARAVPRPPRRDLTGRAGERRSPRAPRRWFVMLLLFHLHPATAAHIALSPREEQGDGPTHGGWWRVQVSTVDGTFTGDSAHRDQQAGPQSSWAFAFGHERAASAEAIEGGLPVAMAPLLRHRQATPAPDKANLLLVGWRRPLRQCSGRSRRARMDMSRPR